MFGVVLGVVLRVPRRLFSGAVKRLGLISITTKPALFPNREAMALTKRCEAVRGSVVALRLWHCT